MYGWRGNGVPPYVVGLISRIEKKKGRKRKKETQEGEQKGELSNHRSQIRRAPSSDALEPEQ